MNGYTNKELNKLLSTSSKIKLTGNILFAISKSFVNKIANKAIKTTKWEENLINNYVSKETKDEFIQKKVDKVAKKEEPIMSAYTDLYNSPNSNNEYKEKEKKYYLKDFDNIITKLEGKTIRYQTNGINRFSLPPLLFTQFKKNSKEKISQLFQKKVLNTAKDIKEAIANKSTDTKIVKDQISNTKEAITNTTNKVNLEAGKFVYKEAIALLKKTIEIQNALERLAKRDPKQVSDAIKAVQDKNPANASQNEDFIKEVEPKKR